MKKTLIALIALGGLAQAEVVLSQDFTKLSGYSNDCTINGVEYTSVLPSGWGTANLKNQSSPHFCFNENGAINNPSWTVVSIYADGLNITSANSYIITFDVYATNNETQNVFYLSSDTYSIAIGNSYNDHAFVSVGTVGGAVQGERLSFQVPGGGDGDTGTAIVPTAVATSPHNNENGVQINDTIKEIDVHNSHSYTITLSSGSMEVSVTDKYDNTWSTTVEIADTFDFTSMGWAFDGNSQVVGLKSVSLETIPEPATATLSLLALAGLAMRRRRK